MESKCFGGSAHWENKVMIYRFLFVVLFAMLVQMGFVYGQSEKARPKTQPDPVSLLRLLVQPKHYDGKDIQLIGYLHLEFEGNALYLHKEDYDHEIFENSIWVDVTPKMEKTLKEINDKYVIMRGVFDTKRHGHMGMFSGTLTKITRCEVWSDPKKPLRSK